MRLSVIDLRFGRQPIASPCGRFTLIYNGEIYNYLELAHELKSLGVKLRSLNDTEVLLQAWSCGNPMLYLASTECLHLQFMIKVTPSSHLLETGLA